MIEQVFSDILFSIRQYNVEYAHLDAVEQMQSKGPLPTSGKHDAFVQGIATLIRGCHSSPSVVRKRLDEEGAWPPGLRTCEKIPYNWR
jgi:hypothetical protein